MILVENLTKDYRSNLGSGFILDKINFSICPKKIIAIIGTNGSGKSTLLKILSGEVESDNGNIWYNKINVTNTILKNSYRPLYLDQDSSRDLVNSMTIAENLYLALVDSSIGSLQFPNRREVRIKIKKVIETVGLGLVDRLTQQVRLLSGGEKQAVVLARALLIRSKFLLLDEFVSALTHELAYRFLQIIKYSLIEDDCYCLFVTHNLELAFAFADQFIFFHNGRILEIINENCRETHKRVFDLFANCLKG